jgi:hypothetical protein
MDPGGEAGGAHAVGSPFHDDTRKMTRHRRRSRSPGWRGPLPGWRVREREEIKPQMNTDKHRSGMEDARRAAARASPPPGADHLCLSVFICG